MNKDVIYIDVEDDITAIISKIKASGEKIIALVPPKRTGVLQSAVNLRLLTRAAKNSDKRVVLITNNASLISLAAAASIPVAKNLQSKPEIPESSEVASDDAEDIIDGNDLPVGEHAGLPADDESLSKAAAVAAIASTEDVVSEAEPAVATKPRSAGKTKRSGVKVPNFNTFRKKLFFGILGGIGLLVFLIWAIFIAPHATIIIAAKTTSSSVNTDVILGDTLKTDVEKGTLKAVLKSQKEDISFEFTATGTKNVGKKATGTVELSNQSLSSTGVPAGTKLTSDGGLVFVTDQSATIPASTVGPGCFPVACPGTTTVGVTAAEGGAKYNAESGELSGAPNGADASFEGPTSGGTDKIAKVVTESDVQKAKQQLVDQGTDDIREELKASFEPETAVVEDTFVVDYGEVDSSPAVGDPAEGGSAELTGEVTYKMYGVANSELDAFLKKTLENDLENPDEQRVYDTGASDAQFQDVTKKKVGGEGTLVATGYVGPKINENEIKEQSKGKKFGDIQADVQGIQGVSNVDVKFFPFWLNTVPDDVNRITVKFELDESN